MGNGSFLFYYRRGTLEMFDGEKFKSPIRLLCHWGGRTFGIPEIEPLPAGFRWGDFKASICFCVPSSFY